MRYKIYVQTEDESKYWLNSNGGFFAGGFTQITEVAAPAVCFEKALMILGCWQKPELIDGGKKVVGIHLVLIEESHMSLDTIIDQIIEDGNKW